MLTNEINVYGVFIYHLWVFFIILESTYYKVNVQFETEGNGQNEIVSHMDRSEVKL